MTAIHSKGLPFPPLCPQPRSKLPVYQPILDRNRFSRPPERYTTLVTSMKKLLVLALAFAAFPIIASAQTVICKEISEFRVDSDAARQTLINIEQGITHAIQINNSSVVNSVFSDEFSGVTWFGEVINKAGQIRSIQTSPNNYQFVRISNIQVKIYRDTATVTSLRSERGSAQGHLFNRQFRVLRVYISTPSGWRVVSQQETQLPS